VRERGGAHPYIDRIKSPPRQAENGGDRSHHPRADFARPGADAQDGLYDEAMRPTLRRLIHHELSR
jgi:hypothetical protein